MFNKIRVILFSSVTLILCGCLSEKDSPVELSAASEIKPIEVKAVVITMFEIGDDADDKPGEFQLWKAGQKLDTKFNFSHHHDLYFNEETGVLGIVTGMGTAKSSSAIMALGLDPRFDLTHAYWLVAGIAGVDPEDASIGSAVWSTWLVDGDLAHEIDAREIPVDWKTGYFPLFSTYPYPDKTVDSGHPEIVETEGNNSPNGEAYKINGALADWAFELTKDIPLNDYPAMVEVRNKYVGYENAQKPPFVLKGEHLAGMTFWHGKLLNDWANDWTSYWTNGEGNFVTSAMEDTGSYLSLSYLHDAGKVDKNRFMVLRTASNYSMQPKGLTAAENLALESTENGYAGMQSALESAYMVGSKVVNTITGNWATYKETLPYDVK
jgi:purine nucleoside permease